MSTFKGRDNCTDLLLDAIAEYESDGNYNAVIGDVHSPYLLNNYTLVEVRELGDWLRRVKRRSSSAMGRYQIITATSKTLQSRMELPDNTKFTPEVQDRMGVALMVGRGYSIWWQERMTNLEFLHALSMEWASLPDPFHGGKSHYDGVGPNHAKLTVDQWVAKLKAAAAAKVPS